MKAEWVSSRLQAAIAKVAPSVSLVVSAPTIVTSGDLANRVKIAPSADHANKAKIAPSAVHARKVRVRVNKANGKIAADALIVVVVAGAMVAMKAHKVKIAMKPVPMFPMNPSAQSQ
jgi:predicted peroxiredoxin